jgi:hypothetical protein
MLYVGHFSFSEHAIGRKFDDDDDNTPWHGIFTCMAEADTVHAAFDKFKALISQLRRDEDLFDGVEEVYLDACVEITTVPDAGMLTHFSLREGEDTGGISTALRGVPEHCAAAYQLGSDTDEDDANDEDDHDIEPFMTFEASETSETSAGASAETSARAPEPEAGRARRKGAGA